MPNRLFVNAVPFVAQTGVPWRDLPERFGKWNSVWRRFDRWCGADVWPGLADALGDPDLAELHLDSTSVKAQHSAAGDALLRRMRARIKPDPTRKRRYDRERHKRRNVTERFFGSIKRGFCRVATRYEKNAENDLGFAWLAALLVSHG